MKIKCGEEECKKRIYPFDENGMLELFCEEHRSVKNVDISN